MQVKTLKNGFLPKGVHLYTWKEFALQFGTNAKRIKLLDGLKNGLDILYEFGCREIYIGGSFVTNKVNPKDIDVCYDNIAMNLKQFKKKHPAFFDIKYGQKKLVEKYCCEFYSYNSYDNYIIDFFSFSRSGEQKGIIKINLNNVFDDKKRKTI